MISDLKGQLLSVATEKERARAGEDSREYEK
jgi:hypothetical protein